jgi:hypothetical protein
MIIDDQPPDRSSRRWPFLMVWSVAAITIVFALLLTHPPASQLAPVTGDIAQPPSPGTSGPARVLLQPPPVGSWVINPRLGEQLPTGATRTTRLGDLSFPGAIVYLDYTGQRIAVGSSDDLPSGGVRNDHTTEPR